MRKTGIKKELKGNFNGRLTDLVEIEQTSGIISYVIPSNQKFLVCPGKI